MRVVGPEGVNGARGVVYGREPTERNGYRMKKVGVIRFQFIKIETIRKSFFFLFVFINHPLGGGDRQ